MSDKQTIFKVNETYKWVREPLFMRLPDGSLFCEIFLGGEFDGCKENILAAVRSDDDGKTWSDMEIVKHIKGTGCWAGSVFAHNETGYIFWSTLDNDRSEMTQHLLYTGSDGHTFEHDRLTEGIGDIRRGTTLRNGKVLLPVAWHEIADNNSHTEENNNLSEDEIKNLANVGGARIAGKISYCGVVEPNADFTEFKRYGRIHHLTPDGPIPSVPLFENQIAELSNGSLAMLIRGDLTNRLWRSDSEDGGHTWTDPVITDIPNPGTKPLIINLPDGRIVLVHNPCEKDYNDTESHIHAYRTHLELWISSDDMKSWSVKEPLSPALDVAQYPDGFYDKKTKQIYLVWENDFEVFFKTIDIFNTTK